LTSRPHYSHATRTFAACFAAAIIATVKHRAGLGEVHRLGAIRSVRMLTLDKLRVYQNFDGNIDGWARASGGSDGSCMTDDDWFLIEDLRQGLDLVVSGRASPTFAASLEQRLRELTADEATRQALRELPSTLLQAAERTLSETNKCVVLDYIAAFNRGDVDAVCRSFGPGALVYGVLGWGEVDAVKGIWNDLIHCFDMKLEVESMIADGDTVAVRYTERGQSIGAFRGGPVTGKRYEVVAMEWFVLKDGRIDRRWGARDAAAMFRQMGLPLP